jgi:hypothetical protein
MERETNERGQLADGGILGERAVGSIVHHDNAKLRVEPAHEDTAQQVALDVANISVRDTHTPAQPTNEQPNKRAREATGSGSGSD